jgi:hypothetical protein
MENVETGFPYEGAKEYYIINIDDSEHLSDVIMVLEKNVLIPKKEIKARRAVHGTALRSNFYVV